MHDGPMEALEWYVHVLQSAATHMGNGLLPKQRTTCGTSTVIHVSILLFLFIAPPPPIFEIVKIVPENLNI